MAKRLSEVELRLDIELEDFSTELHKGFVTGFAAISGAKVKEIATLSLRRGCTVIRLRLPDEAAKTFLELYHKYVVENCPQDLWPTELREFIEKFKVENFTRYTSDVQIVIREKPKGCGIAFVHGWTGNSDTFGRWPAFLWNEFGCPTAVFEYPTGVLRHSPSTIHLAAALAEWIRNTFHRRQIALITHSLGGLIARRFIVDAKDHHDHLDQSVRNIVFVASPHGGNAIARIAAKVPALGSDQVKELSNNSPILLDLNKRWTRWTSENTPHRCRIKCLYGSADEIVTGADAQGLDPEPIPILGKGHRDIVKPEDESAPIAQSVRRFLIETRFFEDALKSESDRQNFRDHYFVELPGGTRPGEERLQGRDKESKDTGSGVEA